MPLAAFRKHDHVDKTAVSQRLIDAGVPGQFHEEILEAMPADAVGVVLYGSVARGDISAASDIDLLVISDDHETTRAVGRANVTIYDEDQFRSAAGTLYGMHIARDGVVLHDSGDISGTIATFGDVEVRRVQRRLSQLAMLMELPDGALRSHLPGFIRHARYVLRTATYLAALEEGKPCFSVSELAERAGDPELVALLSSHLSVQGEPTWEVLMELRQRVREQAASERAIEFETLADAIVGYAQILPDVSDSGILILNRRSSDPYAVIPRVIL